MAGIGASPSLPPIPEGRPTESTAATQAIGRFMRSKLRQSDVEALNEQSREATPRRWPTAGLRPSHNTACNGLGFSGDDNLKILKGCGSLGRQ